VKGAVVAVHCPEDEPHPFWLCHIDADPDGADETMITWLEPTGKRSKLYVRGSKDPIATTSIICTIREAGRWKGGRGFTLTPAERQSVLKCIEAEAQAEQGGDAEENHAQESDEEGQQAALPAMVHLDGLPRSGETCVCSELADANRPPKPSKASQQPTETTPLGKCTACGCDAEADDDGAPRLHPKLAVLLCERCLERDTRVFEVDVRPTPPPQFLRASFVSQRHARFTLRTGTFRRTVTRCSVAGAEWAEI
jgi:hypothetical protein